jgi:tetratricopeptide (TPR) repeat protein
MKNSELEARLHTVIETFIEKKKYEPAIEDLLKMQQEFGDFDIVNYYLGICYTNSNDQLKAIECLNNVSGSDELSIMQMIQTNMILGFLFTELEDLSNAEKAFKEVISINPQSAMSYSALGYVYYLSKKYDLAIFNFKKSLQIDPNNASAHNNLGYTYAEIGINLSEAVVECRRAVALNPSSAAYHDSLGWVHFTLGNFKEAVNEFNLALKYPCKEQYIINDHLNMAIKKRDA